MAMWHSHRRRHSMQVLASSPGRFHSATRTPSALVLVTAASAARRATWPGRLALRQPGQRPRRLWPLNEWQLLDRWRAANRRPFTSTGAGPSWSHCSDHGGTVCRVMWASLLEVGGSPSVGLLAHLPSLTKQQPAQALSPPARTFAR